MIDLFNTVLYQPLFNFLVWLYNILPGNDIGLAIVILTVLIKLVLYPFSLQALRAQKALVELQPQIEGLKNKYKDRKDLMTQEMMKLYKDNKVNPFSSCLPLLIQLPFLIAVYQVFIEGLDSQGLENLYPFIANPGHINAVSMGFLDLGKSNLILAILAGAAQFWQVKIMPRQSPPKNMPGSKDEGMAAMMNKQMLYFMPIITVLIGASLPGGLTFYWLLTTLLSVGQQYLYFRKRKGGATGDKHPVAASR
jgi:YidC/Oxa1 family membrane protein insertase